MPDTQEHQSGSTSPPEKQPPVARPRINIIEQVFYQGPEVQPLLIESRLGFMVNDDEQPYQRNSIKVGLEWQQVDLGWMKGKPISLVVICNQSLEQSSTLEIGIKVPNHNWIIDFTQIRPGLQHKLEPTQVENIYIRSRDKPSKYHVRVYPV